MERYSSLIVKNGNHILLNEELESSKQIEGSYSIPGGRIRENETPTETAIRELKEETGLITYEMDLTCLGEYFVHIRRKNDTIELARVYLYKCNRFEGHLEPSPETFPKWIDVEIFKKGIKTSLLDDYFYDIVLNFV